MSTERLIAQAWANHAATTVGVERAGEFVPLAECSGHGRMSTDDEVIARRLVACWNACIGVPTDWLEAQSNEALAAMFGTVAPLHMRLQNAMQEAVAAKNQRDALLAALNEIVTNDPYNQSSAGVVARRAIKAAEA